MPEDRKLSALTRSLILGVSLGTLGLTQVGCTSLDEQAARATVQELQGEEAALLNAALQSKSPEDVDAFLLRYPRSRGVAPLLRALPPATVASLSPRAVSGLPASTIQSLPASVQSQLPAARPAQARQPAPQPTVVRESARRSIY